MLSLTKMLIGDNYSGDELRYTVNAFSQTDGVAEGRGPVVAWNYTRTCNLHCRHCYSRSENRHYENELNTEEALRLIDVGKLIFQRERFKFFFERLCLDVFLRTLIGIARI